MAFDKRNFMSARYDVFAIVVLTLINSVMLMSGSGSYMLFSAYIPYQFIFAGLLMSGRLEGYEYTGPKMGNEALYIALAIAILIVIAYLVLAVLSAKHYGCLIAAAALFGVDTVYLLLTLGTSVIVDLIFHIIIMVMLVRGCISARRFSQAVKYLKFVKENGPGAMPSEQKNINPDNEYFNSSENGYFHDESSYFPSENTSDDNKNEKSDDSGDAGNGV